MTRSAVARWLALAAALAAIVLVAWWWQRRDPSSRPDRVGGGPVASSTMASATPSPAGGSAATAKRVFRLTPEQRAAVSSRIQAAKAARPRPAPALPAAPSAPANPASHGGSGETGMATVQQVLDQLMGVADEIRGYTRECAASAPEVKTAAVKIILTGDSDIGTLIDAPDPVLSDGKPVPAAFDECIRAALQSLELPPVATGDTFKASFELTF